MDHDWNNLIICWLILDSYLQKYFQYQNSNRSSKKCWNRSLKKGSKMKHLDPTDAKNHDLKEIYKSSMYGKHLIKNLLKIYDLPPISEPIPSPPIPDVP